MSRERRLLVISHGFPPYYGGAEHVAGHLAAAAVASGNWTVEVLTSDIGGRLPMQETWRGVCVTRVHTRKKAWAQHSIPEHLSFLCAALRKTEITRPDWIIAHFSLPGGAVARRLATAFSVPYLVVLHGADVPGAQTKRFGAVYPLVKPLVRSVWKQASCVVAVSDRLRALALRTWPEGTIEVVHNGVDTNQFFPVPPECPRPSKALLTMIVVARLVEIKGIQFLLAALSQLSPALKTRLRLRICGAGPYETVLRQQVREAHLDQHVEFVGLLSYSDVPDQLRKADLFILPSLQEGLPLSLLEAMACGLPVVASAVGGIPEVIQDGVNGVLVPAGDSVALGEGVRRLVENPSLRKQMGAAARRSALDWSWETIWKHYEALYDFPES